MHEFGVVILAAGASRRLGRPKQLLEVRGRTLVGLACDAAVASGAAKCVLVLGAGSELIRVEVDEALVEVVVCEAWEEGMAASIRSGVGLLARSCDRIVVMLCDQPFVSAGHLREIGLAVSDSWPIAASRYADGVLGVPCGFYKTEFGNLMGLTGDQGARVLIRNAEVPVLAVDLSMSQDVDTEEDRAALDLLSRDG